MTMDTPAPTDAASPAASPSGPNDSGLRALYSNSPQMFAEQPPAAPAPAPAAQPAAEPAAQTESAAEPAATVDVSAYADLAVPEGFEVAPELMGKATEVFAKAGLSKVQAEQMVAVHAELSAEQEKATQANIAAVDARWRDEVTRTVPAADLNAARRVVSSAPAEVKQLLDVTGLGNHPGLVRWIADLGRQLGGGEPVPVDPYLRMYPSMRERR